MDCQEESSENSGLKSLPKSESFTALILRTLPSCWRRIRTEEGESDDGGFSDHRLRTASRLQLAGSVQFSSLQDQIPGYCRTEQSLNPSHSRPDGPTDRSLTKHRRNYRKTGGRSVMLAVPGREREFRHYNSCHTFTASSSSSFTRAERTQGQVVYRRPHSVDLGGVGRARVRQSRAHLTDEFRRVGIGTCLEGGLFSPVFLLVGSLQSGRQIDVP